MEITEFMKQAEEHLQRLNHVVVSTMERTKIENLKNLEEIKQKMSDNRDYIESKRQNFNDYGWNLLRNSEKREILETFLEKCYEIKQIWEKYREDVKFIQESLNKENIVLTWYLSLHMYECKMRYSRFCFVISDSSCDICLNEDEMYHQDELMERFEDMYDDMNFYIAFALAIKKVLNSPKGTQVIFTRRESDFKLKDEDVESRSQELFSDFRNHYTRTKEAEKRDKEERKEMREKKAKGNPK